MELKNSGALIKNFNGFFCDFVVHILSRGFSERGDQRFDAFQHRKQERHFVVGRYRVANDLGHGARLLNVAVKIQLWLHTLGFSRQRTLGFNILFL